MSTLNILLHPDDRLHIAATPVKNVDEVTQQLVKDMAETMYSASGIGLAATQVNVQQRVIVIDISDTRDNLLVLINPEIQLKEGTVIFEEGCLSVPGVYDQVERSERIMVKALNAEGVAFNLEATGLLSVCIQHEIDHLDGKVFIEYLSRLKQDRIAKKLIKNQRGLNQREVS